MYLILLCGSNNTTAYLIPLYYLALCMPGSPRDAESWQRHWHALSNLTNITTRNSGQPRRVSKARSEPSKAQTQPNIIRAETEEEIQPNFRAETETRNPAASPWHRIWQKHAQQGENQSSYAEITVETQDWESIQNSTPRTVSTPKNSELIYHII